MSAPAVEPGAVGGDPAAPVLSVRDLCVEFPTRDGVVRAVSEVSFEVAAGETMAVLGESGSGKSVTAQAVMGVLDPPGRVTGGRVAFQGRELLGMRAAERRRVNGEGLAMVFQDALSALNPVFSVGEQIAELLRVRRGLGRRAAWQRAVQLIERVHIPAAARRARDYPHQFSGGMRQRIMIAMAIALDPAVLIADEPTTALDVTVQAQVMELLQQLQRETRMALVLITHDLGVVAEVADRVTVMYAGRVVEQGGILDLYEHTAHPYTRGLLASMPRPDRDDDTLWAIPGAPPNLLELGPGCAFAARCDAVADVCRRERPALLGIGAGGRVEPRTASGPSGATRPRPSRSSACHRSEEVLGGRV